MKVRLPPMKNHMHFRKQSDGHSWLVFTRPATGGRRSIAIIHIPDPHRDPTIEWLPGIEHAEHPQVEKLAGEIRRKRLTFEPENRGIYTQSDSSKKSSRNIWSLAVVSVDQRY